MKTKRAKQLEAKWKREKRRSDPDYFNRMKKAWHRKRKDRLWVYHIRARYGFTDEQIAAIEKLRKKQKRCAICGKLPKGKRHHRKLHIDHDHKTGKFRGLLCGNCNTAIGKIRCSKLLRKAARYLECHGSQRQHIHTPTRPRD